MSPCHGLQRTYGKQASGSPVALLAAVAAEMGMVFLGDANGGDWLDEGEVLTVERMQRDMIEWEEWKQKKKLLDGQET